MTWGSIFRVFGRQSREPRLIRRIDGWAVRKYRIGGLTYFITDKGAMRAEARTLSGLIAQL